MAVAAKATEAADTLMAWLQTQPRAAGGDPSRGAPNLADSVAAAGTAAASAQSAPVYRQPGLALYKTVACPGLSATRSYSVLTC
jgi:hypothetical protein